VANFIHGDLRQTLPLTHMLKINKTENATHKLAHKLKIKKRKRKNKTFSFLHSSSGG
jgi:hypothetical protein